MDLPVRWFVVVLPARLRRECSSEKFNKVPQKQHGQSDFQFDGVSAVVTFFDGGEEFCYTSLSCSDLLKLSLGKSVKNSLTVSCPCSGVRKVAGGRYYERRGVLHKLP